MKKKKIFHENRISIAMSSLASSILTAIIEDELFDVIYEIQRTDNLISTIIPQSQYSTKTKIIIVLILYCIIWSIIAGIIPHIIDCYQLKQYRKKQRHNKSDLLSTYKSCKEDFLLIRNDVYHSISSNNDSILFVNQLSEIIIKLHSNFCSKDSVNKSIVENIFRNGSMIYDMNSAISSYEFLALLDRIEALLVQIPEASTNKLFDYDKNELNTMITDLKNIILNNPRIMH